MSYPASSEDSIAKKVAGSLHRSSIDTVTSGQPFTREASSSSSSFPSVIRKLSRRMMDQVRLAPSASSSLTSTPHSHRSNSKTYHNTTQPGHPKSPDELHDYDCAPQRSPATTAVAEANDYFEEAKTPRPERSPRMCISAIFMITVGTLLALTFFIIGLGKALSHPASGSASASTSSPSSTVQVKLLATGFPSSSVLLSTHTPSTTAT